MGIWRAIKLRRRGIRKEVHRYCKKMDFAREESMAIKGLRRRRRHAALCTAVSWRPKLMRAGGKLLLQMYKRRPRSGRVQILHRLLRHCFAEFSSSIAMSSRQQQIGVGVPRAASTVRRPDRTGPRMSNLPIGISSATTRQASESESPSVPSQRSTEAPAPSRTVLGLTSPTQQVTDSATTGAAKRVRKEQGPNWVAQEISALIEGKRLLSIDEAGCADGRDLMHPDATKWQRVSQHVMQCGISPCHRDGPAYKSKWNQLIPDYKRLADFFSRSGTNELTYWHLSPTERKNEGLPRSFPQDVFFQIHDWYGSRPTMQPLHSRDLMSGDDSNYKTPNAVTEDADDERDSAYDEEYNVPPHAFTDGTEDLSASTHSPILPTGCVQSRAQGRPSKSSMPGPSSAAPKFTMPSGITPHLLSSSDTAENTNSRRASSTGVRRRSVSGHSLIAEATRATGDAMATQMKDIADVGQQLERSKIGVQLRLFTEHMDYQRERDRRLHENVRVANENAKLAIEKQGQVVQCLAQLSNVLSRGFHERLPTSQLPAPSSPRQVTDRAGPSQPGPLQPSGSHAAPSSSDDVLRSNDVSLSQSR